MGEKPLGRPKLIPGESTTVSTYVSTSTAKAITAAAVKADRPVSAIVRDVLDRHFLKQSTK